MIEGAILAIIYALVIALVIYVILWVLQSVAGIALPEKVVQIIWIVFALVCLLLILRVLLPAMGIKMATLLPLLV